MTQPSPAAQPARLRSEMQYDDRGNFSHEGELYRPGESLPDLCRRIETHLTKTIAGGRFALRGERFTGGRRVVVELLDAPNDLSDEGERRAFETMLHDEVERFNNAHGNFHQDYLSCSFFTHIRIGTTYWAALAAKRGAANPVQATVSLAQFKRRVKPGDQLKLIAAHEGHRMLGSIRAITAVRSADIILEGKSYLTLPRASAFACDGRLIRIANGNDNNPDEHLLYEWIPAAG
ncbi:hypothetical protein DFR49_0719 [Hephaestia caeni]|uniref:Uncharacterized protein n=1 Tax=Hephaestia caeni TaxID=645617 RepID=A0A397P9C2_9SPHN|nr:hypothetical protein [Hephaestia caeni]RIA46186.1 hypothetical protein DFR49_0719 [Hephaestia caeni]